MTGDASALERAVEEFLHTEESLRTLMASAEQLAAATATVDDARTSVVKAGKAASASVEKATVTMLANADNAQASLVKAEKSIADGASALYQLASELKDNARELKNTAVALRGLNPDAITMQLANQERQLKIIMMLSGLCAVLAAIAVAVAI